LGGEIPDLVVDGAPGIAEGEELDGEVFGEDDQLTFIIGRRFNEGVHLIAKLLPGLDRPDEVLEGCDADAFLVHISFYLHSDVWNASG
jgi:hypothetical protein